VIAIVLQPKLPHYLFWGDSNIYIATTNDLINYKNTGKTLIETRKGMFDEVLVETGPEPLKLSDGNYLFLYNAAEKTNEVTPRPNWNLKYHIGYLILNGTDPTQVLYRSDKPLFSPVLDWERCVDKSIKALMPNGKFVFLCH